MNKVVSWVLGVLILLGAIVGFLGLRPAANNGNLARQMAPDFTLPNYQDGRPVRLSDYRGKVVLVNFWATWCPPCRGEVPEFVRVEKALGSKGFEILGLSVDQGGAQAVAPFAQQFGINYPVALADQQVADAYGGIRGIPTSFLIDRQGRVAQVFPGAIDAATLTAAVQPLL